jgi:hypothetical protein
MIRDPGMGLPIVQSFCCWVATLFAQIDLMMQGDETKGTFAVLSCWLAESMGAIS